MLAPYLHISSRKRFERAIEHLINTLHLPGATGLVVEEPILSLYFIDQLLWTGRIWNV